MGGSSNFGRSDWDTIERVGAGGTPLCCRRNRVSAMRSGTFWTGQNPNTASWTRLPSGLVALCFLCLARGWRSVGWNVRYVPISLGCLNLHSESLSQAWKPWRGSCHTASPALWWGNTSLTPSLPVEAGKMENSPRLLLLPVSADVSSIIGRLVSNASH